MQKPYREQQLLDAINEALRRDAAQRAPAHRTEGFASLAATLTARERDVLDLALKGQSSKVIARELAISHRTVEQHRGRLLEKFNVGSVTELVRLAFDRGAARAPGAPRADAIRSYRDGSRSVSPSALTPSRRTTAATVLADGSAAFAHATPMPITAYVVDPDPAERARIEAAIATIVDVVTFVDRDELAGLTTDAAGIVIASVDPDGACTLGLVQDLRSRKIMLPVLVLGRHSAFRTAVDVARLDATDFLERPATARQLRAAVTRLSPQRARRRGRSSYEVPCRSAGHAPGVGHTRM